MRISAIAGAAALATAGFAAPAFAALPDFQATPYECAAYDPATHSCESISSPAFETENTGIATSRIQFAYRPNRTDLDAAPVLLDVTVSGPFEIRDDDVFCSDYAASAIDAVAVDPATSPATVAGFEALFTAGFVQAGYVCAFYTLEGDAWMFHLEGIANIPPERIWLFDAEAGARLTLRPRPF